MNETAILQSIRLGLSQDPAVRIFRNNVGTGWTGSRITRLITGQILIYNPRPLHAGLCNGSSDLIGWKSVTITPDMIGNRVAVFVAVEAKGEKGKATPEQMNFIGRVIFDGGLAGVARSVNEAKEIITP